jgi:hypothetical protein
VSSLVFIGEASQPTKWTLVAQYMPGRTDASVRSRYFVLEKQRNRQEAKAQAQAAAASGASGGKKKRGRNDS